MCIGIVKDTCPPDDPSGVGELAQDAMTCGDQAGLVDPVRETGLLDAPERESLHAVAELAAWICGTPMAAVSRRFDRARRAGDRPGLLILRGGDGDA